MLSSLRTPILASLMALAFAACGGGGGGGTKSDGGTDGPHVQFDGPRNQTDGPLAQQDGGQQDGGTGACVASGGQAVAAVCTNSKPCTCPADCVNAFKDANPSSKASGGCWLQPSTSGCANSNEQPVRWSDTDPGHCYPVATMTGSFDVPIGTAQTAGGTVSLQVNINGANVNLGTGAQGYAEHDTTSFSSPVWIINLFSAPAAGNNYFLMIIIDDPQYVVGNISLDGTSSTSAVVRLDTAVVTGTTFTSETVNAFNYEGTLNLTAAPTTSGNVTGSFSGASMMGYTAELCGPNSTPC